MRSGPGEARTILLSHIISARPSKQPFMVRTFLKVYMELISLSFVSVRTIKGRSSIMELGSSFLFLQEQIKDIIIIGFANPRIVSTNPVSRAAVFFAINSTTSRSRAAIPLNHR